MNNKLKALFAPAAAAMAIAATPAAHANRVVGQQVVVSSTGSPCTHRACAKSAWVEALVPPGATIRAIRTMTTANYPDDRAHPTEIPAGADIGWSEFSTPETWYDASGAAHIRAQYWNRSHNRSRVVQIVVDFE